MFLFLELLQVSLGTRDLLSRVPSSAEWEGLLEEAKRHAVVGFMLSGVERLSQEQRPALENMLLWIGQAQIIEEKSLLHQQRSSELTGIFKKAGFDSCILKGLSSAARYPNPLRRECGDIDLWVDGGRKAVTRWLQNKFNIDHDVYHHLDANIFKDVNTEIHFHPSWLYNPFHNIRLQSWFDDNKKVASARNNKGYNVTSAEFDIVFQLTHMFHHFLEEGLGLRQLVDYYYYVVVELNKQNQREKINKSLETITSIGLNKFLGAMMWVLKDACGLKGQYLLCEPNEKEGRSLLKDIVASGNFGKQRKGETLKRNSLKRYWIMMKHYPTEVFWMIP